MSYHNCSCCCCCYSLSLLTEYSISATMVQRIGVVGHDVMGLVASRTTFRATQLYSLSIYEFQYIFPFEKRILFRFFNLCVHLCMKTFIIHSVFTCTRKYIKCLSSRVCLLYCELYVIRNISFLSTFLTQFGRHFVNS